jgi:hypothetical protein
MDSWIQGDDGELEAHVSFTERSQDPIGVSPVATKETMLHFIQRKTKSPYLISDPIEKSRILLNRTFQLQFNHTVDHGRIINIGPEGEPRSTVFERAEVEGP